MNANEQNLVTADKYFDVEISGTWSSADTTAVIVHNYTTDATRYINIYTTGSARHDGTAYKSGAYKLRKDAAMAVDVQTEFTTIDGLVFEMYGTSRVSYVSLVNLGEKQGVIVKNNIIYLNGNLEIYSGYVFGLGSWARVNAQYIYNNVAYGWKINEQFFGAIHISCAEYYEMTSYIYSNTVYKNRVGISTGGGNSGSNYYLKNNIAYNNDIDYSIGTHVTSSNNLSKDATSPDTSYRSKTLTFVNTTAGSEDFHLVSTDTDAIDKGADLSGTFTTDIDGTTRTGTWDIGADEFVATATANIVTINNATINGLTIN